MGSRRGWWEKRESINFGGEISMAEFFEHIRVETIVWKGVPAQ